MKKISIFLTLLFFIVCPAFAGHKAKIKTHPIGTDYYESITEMTAGPINWVYKNEKHAGVFFRFVVTTSEIYNSIILEEVIIGDEGCCKKVNEVRALTFRQFRKEFGFIGEQTGVKFHKWLSPNSAEFFIHERKFKILDMEKKGVTIQEIEGQKINNLR